MPISVRKSAQCPDDYLYHLLSFVAANPLVIQFLLYDLVNDPRKWSVGAAAFTHYHYVVTNREIVDVLIRVLTRDTFNSVLYRNLHTDMHELSLPVQPLIVAIKLSHHQLVFFSEDGITAYALTAYDRFDRYRLEVRNVQLTSLPLILQQISLGDKEAYVSLTGNHPDGEVGVKLVGYAPYSRRSVTADSLVSWCISIHQGMTNRIRGNMVPSAIRDYLAFIKQDKQAADPNFMYIMRTRLSKEIKALKYSTTSVSARLIDCQH